MCRACTSCLLPHHNIPIQQWYRQTEVITIGMQKDFSNGLHVSFMADPFILTYSVPTQTLFHINSRGSLGSTEHSWRNKVLELSAFYPPWDILVAVRLNAFLRSTAHLPCTKVGEIQLRLQAQKREKRKGHIESCRLQAARFSGERDGEHQD